ncbi:hypothetical protein GCM10017714_25130 [Curtobacterium pusillum]|uniref:Uncharacterized protein n=1 Tax=Curtobacterium pusillum TaxID=69373 RepID=A0ABX2MHU2_9MICO|nr:hypothetical protein [Curtobacterium pusillum]NUU15079.1 hypothetical protein [Curtobacterium pusillum]GLK32643.1 hypothetical protein GCM10017610_29280 [Curtobacterium pusillum]
MPRLDRLVVAWASVVVASTCLVLVVLGLTVAEVPGHRAPVWVGAGGVLVVLSIVVALVQFRRAARAPRD